MLTFYCYMHCVSKIFVEDIHLAIWRELEPSPLNFLAVGLKFEGREGTFVKGPGQRGGISQNPIPHKSHLRS